jgi:regulator of cell morphogenesis and NO signaling
MSEFRNIDFNALEADEIIDFIEKKHHGYVMGMLELLQESCGKAKDVDNKIAPQLVLVCQLLHDFSLKVLKHIQNEEEILFPYIKKLLQIKRASKNMKFLNVNLSETTLKLFSDEHDELMTFWEEIKVQTNNFETFENASPITSLFFAELKDFEKDLIHHFELEDKVLFPKLCKLEKEINHITDIAFKRTPGE